MARKEKTGSRESPAQVQASSPKTTAPRTVSNIKEPSEREKKKQNFIVRTVWTLVMIVFFVAILGAGHIWVIALVGLIQILTFKEVINLSSEPAREKRLPWGRKLNWYFLATTIYFLEGENLIYYFKNVVLVDSLLLPLAIHHRFLSYCLYIIGFVYFVYSLEKGHYKFQFTQFCITHMTLFLVVIQAHFIVNNIFAGLFWFMVPAALVICNDIFAYLCGITFGRTPLIAISPKKTVEGFVGAWICTIVFGVILSHVLIQYSYIICPMEDLGQSVFNHPQCTPDPVFLAQIYRVPPFLQTIINKETIELAPIHIHVMFLATFASLIAPFGGFFASGLKRTFQVKDFGDTIPGHGGITDRMDCQFLMGFFSYLYYESFVSNHHLSVTSILQLAITSLSTEEQIQLVVALEKYLHSRGVADSRILESLAT
ncbi:phosphatidate cytidylyltransferase [Sugiyamaella lignohabitans]|uniref:Phosphatidate cytidylyltransferase n=1 Tax=Sugiyamaella lignohabitans TaxID=796027 RepID=A0A167DQY6_9ASCO|nr:phosphatidate cytidylyltransferase [Sugiyamaella lignohabitans]ANB13186.1 phosphatidate cytidylyltransferase [Sugiyamaella lignohabitans]